MFHIIDDFFKIPKLAWNEFVESHLLGNFFQTFYYFEILSQSKKTEPFVFALIDESQKIHGILLGSIQRLIPGSIGNLISRVVIIGGPLVSDNNPVLIDQLIVEFDKKYSRKIIYFQFRNMWDWGQGSTILTKSGYFFEDHLNILINLTQGSDDIWSGINTSRRKQIKRGYNRGITVSEIDEYIESDIATCHEIISKVYKKIKLPFPEKSFFLESSKILFSENHLKIFVAITENKIIGCRFVIIFKEYIFDWYAGSDSEYYSLYPNDILPWEVFKWGSNNGFSIFDFGGAGKPDQPYGVRDYKLKFGGTLVNYGRFIKINNRFLYSFGNWTLALIQSKKNN